ncbi:MAG: RNA polymerase sigma-70 factor (ECF subfamily) [Myxococcota bacterium]
MFTPDTAYRHSSMADAAQIAACVARARVGDSAAWAALHTIYRPVLHAVALAHGPPEAAEDVVQEAFARGMERLDRLHTDDAFGGWLCTIARNLATDGYRRRSRFAVLRDVFFARSRPTVEASQALQAIQGLPETYRELMMMRLVEQLTGPEIAERLGRPVGSVRVSLHRGMALLRDALGDE